MNKLSFFTRVVTVPPVFATALLLVLFFTRPEYIGNVWFLLAGIFFLTVLPLLAYPLQKFIPRYKDRGREGQRKLAVIFSFAGYVLGMITVLIFNAPRELKMVFCEYVLCGLCIFICDKVFKFKASGHACGSVGPAAMLLYLGQYIAAIVFAILIIPAFVSSLTTKRHTLKELISGSIVPLLMLVIVYLIFGA
ncbi:MAG: hypothetical protein IJC64_04760 [Clostridia bacterium]|nr:hypothetical protein [Clostridia bacterium]